LSHSLQPHFPYPDPSQREDFYRAYLSVEVDARNGEEVMRKRKDVPTDKVDALEREVRVWSPACSVFWALWGIVQGEAQVRGIVEKSTEPAEFDYLVSLVSADVADFSHMPLRGWRCSERRRGKRVRLCPDRDEQVGGDRIY
jgi:hypothetical protein